MKAIAVSPLVWIASTWSGAWSALIITLLMSAFFLGKALERHGSSSPRIRGN